VANRPDVNFEEIARGTDDFNAAQLKAVCVEAGMLALRRDALEVNHEDFNEGIIAVQVDHHPRNILNCLTALPCHAVRWSPGSQPRNS